jgi:hypothetical protein
MKIALQRSTAKKLLKWVLEQAIRLKNKES